MNTVFFDSGGTPLCMVDTYAELGAFPGAAYCRQVPDATEINAIYLDTGSGEVTTKMNMSLLVSLNEVAGIPTGATAAYENESVVVDDGLLEIESDAETTVVVTVTHPCYFSVRVEVPCAS